MERQIKKHQDELEMERKKYQDELEHTRRKLVLWEEEFQRLREQRRDANHRKQGERAQRMPGGRPGGRPGGIPGGRPGMRELYERLPPNAPKCL